jgi:hypothetical protein
LENCVWSLSRAAGTRVHADENPKEIIAVIPLQIAVDTKTEA